MIEQALEHHRAGRLAEAAALYQEILQAHPDNADAWYLLGAVAHQVGDPERAVELLEQSLAVVPDQPRCYSLLGAALLALGKTAEAATAYRRALALDGEQAALLPRDAEVLCNLGDALQSRREWGPALAFYRHALELNPEFGRGWYAAGCAESARREFVAAAECFRRALATAPEWPEAQHNLGRALFKLGQVEEAMDLFRRAAASGNPGLPLAAIALVIPGDPRSDNQAVLEARREWAERELPAKRPARARTRGGRPKIGYVSSFFADRNWMKPVWGLINRHDRERFEIHLFSDAPASRIEHGYRADPRDRFHDISGVSNHDLAQRIEEAEIDLLMDLNGYSAMERLPLIALHPAPVVAGWFNLYATTGMASYDYLIGDDRAIPPAEERFYCEKIVRVSGSYLTFEVSYSVPPVADPPCLTGGAITFGSLAPLYKVTGAAIGAWSRILQAVPGSRMLMKNRELGSEGTRRFVNERFAAHGIGGERLRLEGPAEHYQFLESYGAMDIALDTFPYNGGTTTTEAIWQGVPVVTFSGDRWVSRTSASILHAGGLGELIGRSLVDYEAIAIQLANSPQHLAETRRSMRGRLGGSSVCDTETLARNMERIYEEMLL